MLEHRRIMNSGGVPSYKDEPDSFERTLDQSAQHLETKIGKYRKSTVKEIFLQYMRHYQRIRTGAEPESFSMIVRKNAKKAYKALKDDPVQTLGKMGRVAIGSGKYVYDSVKTFFMGADSDTETEAERLQEVLADNDINPHLLVKEPYHIVHDAEGFEEDVDLASKIDDEFERMVDDPSLLRSYLEQTGMHDGAIDLLIDRFEQVSGRESKKVLVSSIIKFSSLASAGVAAIPIVLLADQATEAYEQGLREQECEPLDGSCEIHQGLKDKLKKHAGALKNVMDQGTAKIKDAIGWFYDRLKAIPDGFRKFNEAAKKPEKLRAFLRKTFKTDSNLLDKLDDVLDAMIGPGINTFL